jgi:hypothetical protein
MSSQSYRGELEVDEDLFMLNAEEVIVREGEVHVVLTGEDGFDRFMLETDCTATAGGAFASGRVTMTCQDCAPTYDTKIFLDTVQSSDDACRIKGRWVHEGETYSFAGTLSPLSAVSMEDFEKRFLPTDIGQTEPICPYCETALDKMPGRKKACPACGKFIYVRKRPLDAKRGLFREDQLRVIGEQQEYQYTKNTDKAMGLKCRDSLNGFLYERMYYYRQRELLTKELGREPTDEEVDWRIQDLQEAEAAREHHWGAYRCARMSKGSIRSAQDRPAEALDLYLELFYLDLCDVTNSVSADPQWLREHPPFGKYDFDDEEEDIKIEVLIVADRFIECEKLLERTGFGPDEVEVRLLAAAERVARKMGAPELFEIPKSGEEAWAVLAPRLFRTQD